jgi:hypothetical protein
MVKATGGVAGDQAHEGTGGVRVRRWPASDSAEAGKDATSRVNVGFGQRLIDDSTARVKKRKNCFDEEQAQIVNFELHSMTHVDLRHPRHTKSGYTRSSGLAFSNPETPDSLSLPSPFFLSNFSSKNNSRQLMFSFRYLDPACAR